MAKKILNIVYFIIGLIISYLIIERLYQEGTFGNNPRKLFLILIGLTSGLLILSASICLSIGQLLDFLNKSKAKLFSRISYILTLITLATDYFVFKSGFIFGYITDFLIFSLLFTIFYLPIIISWKQKRNK